MKTFYVCMVAVAFLLAAPLSQAEPQEINPSTRSTNAQEFEAILSRLQPRILGVANVMPEKGYSFVPTGGEFQGVRTFARQLKHIAADNYLDGAAVLGENPPGDLQPGEEGSSRVKTKAEIVAYVADSFAYLRRAVRTATDENAPLAKPAFLPYGPSVTSRMRILLANVGHTQDHYGQLVEYLRMNGIVPPESQSGNMTVGQALDFWIGIAESEIVPAADAMPAEKYSFAPSPAMGEFKGVRTFGQQVKHLAANNYRMAAYILGQEPTPDQKNETGPDDVQTKAEIMAYVRGSFAMLHRAAGAITPENALQPLASYPSPRQQTRMQLAEDVVTHSYDHYGQMVEYLRMNGIVPPSSRK